MSSKTPIYDALVRHSEKSRWSFHVPGHKNGKIGIGQHFSSILPLDLTELTGLDDLHEATGIIDEAQRLTALFYGANHSYFLVGGSTAGNLVMLLSAFQEGDAVLVQRNCHKSIINGLHLAKLRPVFITPQIDPIGKFATGVTLSTVEKAFQQYPEVKGLVLTNPNYYGMSMDLSQIVQFMHLKGLPVLVDEAHGAHFGIDDRFPTSALSYGADLVVQSAHKTLPAMTMGSYLHSNSSIIDEEKIKYYLQAVQSSSPSYPIMASLDLARAYLESLTEQRISRILSQISSFRQGLNDIPQIKVVGASCNCQMDPLKITVQSRCCLSGYQLQERLEASGIFTELADPYNVLFVMPLGEISQMDVLLQTIKSILANERVIEIDCLKTNSSETISMLELSYQEMLSRKSVDRPIAEAKGDIAAESVIPYPPGVPLIVKGERITKEMIDTYHHLLKMGARFQGCHHGQLKVYI
ncbi:aminotransferase class I/II-fold pyridoxal phosphate-dependent enzyme [Fictibacillus sp. Mic-4]|uniref:aminotransferase class I/II-fold pyridoxal phosphate-dependent enzyme n=1 Tax=Fictibacillus sp. Mic-4 TaxID=3132826 RepID=UPI003CFB5C1E